jgi:DNA-binding IclR family transcriptional regulator
MRILEAFDLSSPSLTLTQISRRAQMPLATVHRLASDLEDHGLLERLPDRSYRVGVRLWELACLAPGALGLRELAMPHLQDVHATVRQHTQLGILQGREVLFIERLSTPEAVRNMTLVGGRVPLNASSSGQVLLAHASSALQEEVLAGPLPRYTDLTVHEPSELRRILAAVRREGYVVSVGYVTRDATGIAVPVYGHNDVVVAALSVVVPSTTGQTQPLVVALQSAARNISKALLATHLPDSHAESAEGGRYRGMISSSLDSLSVTALRR